MRAQRLRRVLKEQFDRVMKDLDVLITPTTSIPTIKIGQRFAKVKGKDIEVKLALSRFTTAFNLTGYPAISILCGFINKGLPIGLQIITKEFDELSIYKVARAYKKAFW